MKINFSKFSNDHLLFKSSIREDFDSEVGTYDDKFKTALNLVNVYLIASLNDDPSGSLIYRKLLKMGYSQSDIINSIATGWIEGNTFFELPKLKKSILNNKVYMYLIFPLLSTILILTIVTLVSFHNKSIIFLDIIAFPPLVGVIGLLIFVIFYKIINYYDDK